MKKLKGILVLVLLLALLASPVAVLASDVTGAKYYALIQVSNNGTAATNEVTTCNISTTNLINGGFLNSTANNCAIQSSGGADLPFQPGVTDDPWAWFIWVPAMGVDSIKTDILYTANSTGGKIRYFPDVGGMTTPDNDVSLELGDNFTIEQSGWVNTSMPVEGKANFLTFIEVDANNKLTVYADNATAVNADRDEDVYLYKDEGVGYFDALDIDFEIYMAAASLVNAVGGVAFSDNVVGTIGDFDTNEISVYMTKAAPNIMTLARGKHVATDTYAPAVDTPYYCTLYREAGNNSANCTIYSDPTRETLLDTLVVAGFGATKWRYVYGFINYNQAQAGRDWDGYVKDLIYPQRPALVEKAGAFRTYIGATGNITSEIFDGPSVTATGVESGEHTVRTIFDRPFLAISAVETDNLTPVVSDLVFNAPMWQTECDDDPFVTIDDTGYSFALTGATWTSDGYSFDGNDLITLPNTALLYPASFTWEFWVNPTNVAAHRGLFGSSSANIRPWDAHINQTTGELTFRIIQVDSATKSLTTTDSATTAGVFNHIVFTGDGSTLRAYLDGVVSADTGAYDGTLRIVGREATRLGIARDAYDMIGTMGVVRLYGDALTGDEVLRNYNVLLNRDSGDIDLYSANVTVPNTSANWTYYQNLDDYWDYTEITIDGTQVQYIDWEYDTIFYDSSGYDNDATPSFRGAPSDPDVTAEFVSFLPVAEAQAPAYVLEEGVDFIESVPVIVSEWDVVPPAGEFPLAGVIVAVADATGTPSQLPLVIIAGFTIIALSLAISSIMRKYGSGTIFVKILVVAAVMGVFVAIENFGIDFWMIFVFLVVGIALSMASRHVSWN